MAQNFNGASKSQLTPSTILSNRCGYMFAVHGLLTPKSISIDKKAQIQFDVKDDFFGATITGKGKPEEVRYLGQSDTHTFFIVKFIGQGECRLQLGWNETTESTLISTRNSPKLGAVITTALVSSYTNNTNVSNAQKSPVNGGSNTDQMQYEVYTPVVDSSQELKQCTNVLVLVPTDLDLQLWYTIYNAMKQKQEPTDQVVKAEDDFIIVRWLLDPFNPVVVMAMRYNRYNMKKVRAAALCAENIVLLGESMQPNSYVLTQLVHHNRYFTLEDPYLDEIAWPTTPLPVDSRDIHKKTADVLDLLGKFGKLNQCYALMVSYNTNEYSILPGIIREEIIPRCPPSPITPELYTCWKFTGFVGQTEEEYRRQVNEFIQHYGIPAVIDAVCRGCVAVIMHGPRWLWWYLTAFKDEISTAFGSDLRSITQIGVNNVTELMKRNDNARFRPSLAQLRTRMISHNVPAHIQNKLSIIFESGSKKSALSCIHSTQTKQESAVVLVSNEPAGLDIQEGNLSNPQSDDSLYLESKVSSFGRKKKVGDKILLIDGSASITLEHWEVIRFSSRHFPSWINKAIELSKYARTEHEFPNDSYSLQLVASPTLNQKQRLTAASDLHQMRKNTNTAAALELCRDMFSTSSVKAQHFVILLTDGDTSDAPENITAEKVSKPDVKQLHRFCDKLEIEIGCSGMIEEFRDELFDPDSDKYRLVKRIPAPNSNEPYVKALITDLKSNSSADLRVCALLKSNGTYTDYTYLKDNTLNRDHFTDDLQKRYATLLCSDSSDDSINAKARRQALSEILAKRSSAKTISKASITSTSSDSVCTNGSDAVYMPVMNGRSAVGSAEATIQRAIHYSSHGSVHSKASAPQSNPTDKEIKEFLSQLEEHSGHEAVIFDFTHHYHKTIMVAPDERRIRIDQAVTVGCHSHHAHEVDCEGYGHLTYQQLTRNIDIYSLPGVVSNGWLQKIVELNDQQKETLKRAGERDYAELFARRISRNRPESSLSDDNAKVVSISSTGSGKNTLLNLFHLSSTVSFGQRTHGTNLSYFEVPSVRHCDKRPENVNLSQKRQRAKLTDYDIVSWFEECSSDNFDMPILRMEPSLELKHSLLMHASPTEQGVRPYLSSSLSGPRIIRLNGQSANVNIRRSVLVQPLTTKQILEDTSTSPEPQSSSVPKDNQSVLPN